MTQFAMILSEPGVRVWGLSSRERLARQMGNAGGIRWLGAGETIPADGTVLLIRGDYLFDDRLIQGLVQNPGVVLTTGRGRNGGHPVAAHVESSMAAACREFLEGCETIPEHLPLECKTPTSLASSYQKKLRKIDPPFLFPITPGTKSFLEDRLFSGSYKGVTDLVTKWVWPLPAKWATHLCVRLGIRPNQVTGLGLILVVLAGFLFATGDYGLGLALGWFMTFLDTVDGKLARVTLTSTRLGHILDHGIDLIHPPLWYLAWGIGVGSSLPDWFGLSGPVVIGVIFAGYGAGRLIEVAFKINLEHSGIFCWRPVDSIFRLITARRNPCLVLLTLGFILDRPGEALLAVMVWTVFSSGFLLVRFFMGIHARKAQGPLQSWLQEVDPGDPALSPAKRIFIRRLKIRPIGEVQTNTSS